MRFILAVAAILSLTACSQPRNGYGVMSVATFQKTYAPAPRVADAVTIVKFPNSPRRDVVWPANTVHYAPSLSDLGDN